MMKLLEVKNLKKSFPVYRGILRRRIAEKKAVDSVSFSIDEGEIVGLVGESGSGKTSVGRMLIRILEPTSGEIIFMGENLMEASQKKIRLLRQKIQMVFQDPLSSLNPRKTVLDNIGEALLYHKLVRNKEEQAEKVLKILGQIGLPEFALNQYPHQFSGGQKQRISIGRALALEPKLIICDEAISALDVSIQSQILNLLYELKNSLNLSYLFISHDLASVQSFCDRVLVMYRGKIVESGKTRDIFDNPKHPYTQLLISSIPKKHPRDKKNAAAPKVDRPTSLTGCLFFHRCPLAKPTCEYTAPPTKIVGTQTYDCIY